MHSTASAALYRQAQRLDQQLAQLKDRISLHPERNAMGDPGRATITDRLQHAGFGDLTQAYGPTPAQLTSLQIASEEMDAVDAELARLIDGEYAQLRTRLEQEGVPWTPGR